MPEGEDMRALDRVYGATNEAELSAAYAAWANSYDRETAEMGYCLPFVVTSWLARHVARGEGPLLDAGCGTGLSGPCLEALGYTGLEGFDLSSEMLKLAAARGVYSGLKEARLGAALPYEDGRFKAFIASGVFTVGHAPASGLDELVRITRAGGYGIMTVRDLLIDNGGFGAKFKELEDRGAWQLTEKSPPYRAFVVAEPDVFVHTYVFQVT